MHSVSSDFPGLLSTLGLLLHPHPLNTQGFELLRNRMSTSIMTMLHAVIGRHAHFCWAQRFGLFGAAISTTGDVPRTPAPNSITLTRWVHRLSSTLDSRYPHGIQARRIARKLSASSAIARQSPARQGTQADSCDRVLGAHRFNAQRFDWLACGLSTCDHVVRCACGHVVAPATFRSVACSCARIRSSLSDIAWIRARLAILTHAHQPDAQRAESFCTPVIHTRSRAPSPPPKSLGQIDIGLSRRVIVT
ncbi:hypothetical protein BLA15945_05092 [Burkholderia lata]|uniref:Uncharacterized protein n=1 Tax=Burkholderia lata (strain ATCC 17760 / DSM 23089 / LMG 22485 / NCIMB 9086 / R18194 / 383) TaxID=482957 RepID=A0A6P2PC30_BURL3|nr:hypothetical protein BLA15945_05092 [Burkholderia lata]